MKVNTSTYNKNNSFTGIYTSKSIKKGLEFASDYSALFAASTTLALSSAARTGAIYMTPHTDKENKKLAGAKSLTSGGINFIITLGLSIPLGNAIKKINKNPKAYLKEHSINLYQKDNKQLNESKSYSLATQIFKLGLGAIIAIPKAVLTSKALPYVKESIFEKKTETKDKKNISFKSKEKLPKGVAKVLNNTKYQKFTDKYKDSNFPIHIIAATDIVATGAFIHQTYNSKKIQEERKKALIYNSAISTGLSIGLGYISDKLTKPATERFIEKYKEINKQDPKLEKQIEGIRIAKPVLLIGCLYYILIPFISTALAELADKNPKFDIPQKH